MALRRRVLIVAIAIIAMLAFATAYFLNYELSRHMYPKDALHEVSNLTVKGIATSIEQNHISHGLGIGSYHIFRYFIQLNITEVIWTSEDYLNSSVGGDTVFGSNILGVGYDFSDNPHIAVGEEVECTGFFLGLTDSPYSFILTVSPAISKSFLKLDVVLK